MPGQTPVKLGEAALAQHNYLASLRQQEETPFAVIAVRGEWTRNVLVGSQGDFPSVNALKPLSSSATPMERFVTIDHVNTPSPLAERINSPTWFDQAGRYSGFIRAGELRTAHVRTVLAEELYQGAASNALAARSTDAQTMEMEQNNVAERPVVYACTFYGCRQHFQTAAELLMHKREAHESLDRVGGKSWRG